MVMLFHGAPGTGKTMMANALANKLNKKVKIMKFSVELFFTVKYFLLLSQGSAHQLPFTRLYECRRELQVHIQRVQDQ